MKQFKKHLKIEKRGDDQDKDEDEDVDESDDEKDSDEERDSDEEKDSKKDNTNTDKLKKRKTKSKRFTAISKEVAKLLQRFELFDEQERKDIKVKCQEWKTELKDTNQPSIQAIDDLLTLLDGDIKPKSVLQFVKAKTYYTLYISNEYKVSKRKYVMKIKELGVIPLGKKNLKDKCSTETLVRRIKQIHKNQKLDKLKLPNSVADWTDENFKSVCDQTKKFVTDKSTKAEKKPRKPRQTKQKST